jgi:prephenate dehydrogenase
MYLEDQTDGLVHSITSLVDVIRNAEAMPTIQNHISTIAGTIENVVTSVERTSSEPSSYQAMLVEKSQPVVSILQDCREKLLQASTVGYDGSQPSKEFTQKLPPLAFQVARETKELVSRIMAIEVGRGEEDFS